MALLAHLLAYQQALTFIRTLNSFNALREGMSDATTLCGRVQGGAYGIEYFKIILCAQQILNHYVKF
jgi:hypothetical protein